MAQYTTLKNFLASNNNRSLEQNNEDLQNVLNDLAEASISVSKDISRAGLIDGFLGAQGGQNVQGEDQQKLDVIADNAFIDVLEKGGAVCGVASEENENFVSFNNPKSQSGSYVVLFDPLDGSSNIDVNVSIGTIFSIYKRISPLNGPACIEDMLQKGTEQVAAGYTLYGSSTMFVYTSGQGVNGFTLEPSKEKFYLSHPDMKMPVKGRYYAMNEGNINECNPKIIDYIKYCQSRDNDYGSPYSGRYIGSLVADFHRNLIKGGIYIYPCTKNAPEGRLRLLYECNPLAFISEQAGGLSTTGTQRIMDIQPEKLHQRVAFFTGSKNMVEKAMGFLK
ncbi:MAG: class 1 fructose-bisphosphatase [Crocinitomicaceae bacterium]